MPRYEIDPTASMMSIDARSTVHAIHAETSGLSGWLEADVGADPSKAHVSAGRLEIPLTQLRSGNPLYDSELHRRIDIRRYPTASGVLSEWQPAEREGAYRVRGDVSFRGVTRSVEDGMALSIEDERTVMLDGACTFDIRDFGMSPPRVLALRVYPDVTIRVAVVARMVG